MPSSLNCDLDDDNYELLPWLLEDDRLCVDCCDDTGSSLDMPQPHLHQQPADTFYLQQQQQQLISTGPQLFPLGMLAGTSLPSMHSHSAYQDLHFDQELPNQQHPHEEQQLQHQLQPHKQQLEERQQQQGLQITPNPHTNVEPLSYYNHSQPPLSQNQHQLIALDGCKHAELKSHGSNTLLQILLLANNPARASAFDPEACREALSEQGVPFLYRQPFPARTHLWQCGKWGVVSILISTQEHGVVTCILTHFVLSMIRDNLTFGHHAELCTVHHFG